MDIESMLIIFEAMGLEVVKTEKGFYADASIAFTDYEMEIHATAKKRDKTTTKKDN